MRALFVALLAVLVLALVGWIKFHNTPDQSSIIIDKNAIKQDTEGAVERGNEFLNNARHAVGSDTPDLTVAPQAVPPSETSPQPTNGLSPNSAPSVRPEKPTREANNTTVR